LSAIPLVVPALRDRVEDISILARRLLEWLGMDLGRPHAQLTPDAEHALQGYRWPGNIRELRNVLERALLLSDRDRIGARDLRFDAVGPPDAPPDEVALTLRDLERLHVERVLRLEGGHVGRAARRLGVPRSSLYEKIRRYGIGPSNG
jgi:DNA-binding NtrC family response regulator